jgi:hypothetical protein
MVSGFVFVLSWTPPHLDMWLYIPKAINVVALFCAKIAVRTESYDRPAAVRPGRAKSAKPQG